MSNFIVRKVAVLGAGVMGAQLAAHCVNARVPVVPVSYTHLDVYKRQE